jgi:hypothetical protein
MERHTCGSDRIELDTAGEAPTRLLIVAKVRLYRDGISVPLAPGPSSPSRHRPGKRCCQCRSPSQRS